MTDKIYKKLPGVLQTPTNKNFFESTVEQMFSKANVENIQGFVGRRTTDDLGATGSYLQEQTETRRFYSLSPVVNTVDAATSESTNLVFYDEFINGLGTLGVDLRNHNKLFSSSFYSFMPPINVDKLINYQEYYWDPTGPTTINVLGTLDSPIDIDRDVVGQLGFTPPVNGSLPLRNGMIVRFAGDYVIPASKVGIEYIVEGVGTAIRLVPKQGNFATRFSTPVDDLYDASEFRFDDAGISHSAGNVSVVNVLNPGIGYIAMTMGITGANTAVAAVTVNMEPSGNGAVSNVVVDASGDGYGGSSYGDRAVNYEIADTAVYADIDVMTVTGGNVSITDGLFIDNSSFATLYPEGVIVSDTIRFRNVSDRSHIKVGQRIGGPIGGIVTEILEVSVPNNTVTVKLDSTVTLNYVYQDLSDDPIAYRVNFYGRDFVAEIQLSETATITESLVQISTDQVRTGRNPNTGEFYLVGGLYSFDRDYDGALSGIVVIDGGSGYTNPTVTITGGGGSGATAEAVVEAGVITAIEIVEPGEGYFSQVTVTITDDTGSGAIVVATKSGELPWGGSLTQAIPDYEVMERGATNDNVWSRVNFWYHRQNYIDAGDTVPGNEYRALRPIVEFDHRLELYNHGTHARGAVNIACFELTKNEIDGNGNIAAASSTGLIIDGYPAENSTIVFPAEHPSVSQYVYTVRTPVGSDRVELLRIPDPVLNPAGVEDGGVGFVPFVFADGDVIQIANGEYNVGKEYRFTASGFVLCQEKIDRNQMPLFKLYDTNGIALDDEGQYPLSSFHGNRIFNYQIGTGSDDTVLGFPLEYKPFKAKSEIAYQNYIHTDQYTYTPFGSSVTEPVVGYAMYRLVGATDEFQSYWKTNRALSSQRIFTTYEVTQYDVDAAQRIFFVGCVPDTLETGGLDIRVRVNGNVRTDYTYGLTGTGLIEFAEYAFVAGDFIEIDCGSSSGLISVNSVSKFELPLGWTANPHNVEIATLSEPEYLGHFKNFMESQHGFQGEVLGSNNFTNTSQDSKLAVAIAQTSNDPILAAYLLDNQSHNLVDAIRFVSAEYTKYKSRLRKEFTDYYSENDLTGISNDVILDQVLKRVISYRVGKDVFNSTYVLPFGDNYAEEEHLIADIVRTDYVLDTTVDLTLIENSMLVYLENESVTELLCIGDQYDIINFNPVTIRLDLSRLSVQLGNLLRVRVYDVDRDSAQCPPTPSTMGLYPIFKPEIVADTTFKTPVSVLIGHDGSRTPITGDRRDELMLEFEKRIYNAAQRKLRETDRLPELNFAHVRPGAFRNTGVASDEWSRLQRYYFSNWAAANKVDYVANEFYDAEDPFTWNYRGDGDIPGHWRGWFEYYYDTARPHTHPWEMLGFSVQPSWWEHEYGTDYSSTNLVLWSDLERGIIRGGSRENYSNALYLADNPFRRIGLNQVLPVDSDGNIRAPRDIVSTGSTILDSSRNNTFSNIVGQYQTNSFASVDGLSVSYDNTHVYVNTTGRLNHSVDLPVGPAGEYLVTEQNLSYGIPSLTSVLHPTVPISMEPGAVAVAVNGVTVMNIRGTDTWSEQGEWHYDLSQRGNVSGELNTESGLYYYYQIPSSALGLESWDSEVHSPIIGWAFDGLPIYGPYGYRNYDANGAVIDASITNIRSSFELRSGLRSTGPGGAHTGVFVEDYEYSSTLANEPARADRFNRRYGVTPDSPTTPIHFYVQTIDDSGSAMFPYMVGGGTQTHSGSSLVWAGEYYGTPSDQASIIDLVLSTGGNGYDSANVVLTITGDGTGASGTATVEDGVITGYQVVSRGYGYSTATVKLVGDGTGAVIEAVLDSGRLDALRIIDGGSGYSASGTHVTIVGNGVGASATLVIEDGVVTGVQLTSRGAGYTYATASISDGGSGSGATASVTIGDYDNSDGTAYVNPTSETTHSSVVAPTYTLLDSISSAWKFGDGAPVENAWKYSEVYPYAVVEAMLMLQPAEFATVFADPLKIVSSTVNTLLRLEETTQRRWKFADPAHFRVHGDMVDGNQVLNIGYSQFIHSWLSFQGRSTAQFASDMRSLNTKLAQRMSGFVDKDTLTVRTDQYSTTGKATSLVIPDESVHVLIHTSPHLSRNVYTGVMVERTRTGFKVRGYDKNTGYFTTLRSDVTGPRERVTVGGKPAAFIEWSSGRQYRTGTVIRHRGTYYEARQPVAAADAFDAKLWFKLAALPQVGGATATYYQRSTAEEIHVDYETEFTTESDVYDFLIGLGRYQESRGFTFGEFDSQINAVRNWAYMARQFLFWVTGSWEVGNTLELSPLANRVMFTPARGMVAPINRTDRNQFNILDQAGRAIQPNECEILRVTRGVEVAPPAGAQIYCLVLHSQEIEHALVIDNTTVFNDVIFDPVLSQRHSRLKVKGVRTRDWDGRLLSQGFVVMDDELKPNLDNLAATMGRYHELGYIPVENQVYEIARGQFGYRERPYLRDLDILDDQQVEFYLGMIHNKGTGTSLTKIAKSDAIIQGDVRVFDEWALKIADFGDLENNQSVELKLEKVDIVNDPQLVTLDFPEDVTSVVGSVDVLYRRSRYTTTPTIVISPPLLAGGVQATAQATLNAAGEIDHVTVTNPGWGYGDPSQPNHHVSLRVIAGNVVVDTVDHTLLIASTVSTDWIRENSLGNITSTGFNDLVIMDYLATDAANANAIAAVTTIDLANVRTATQLTAAIDAALAPTSVDFVLHVDPIADRCVESISIVGGGTGYTSANTNIVINAANVEPAVISVAVDGNGTIISANVNYEGLGYASGAVTATVVGDGIGATANVTMLDRVIRGYLLELRGGDFSIISADADLNFSYLDANNNSVRYQPLQRYAIDIANNTSAADILVSIDNRDLPYLGGANWQYHAGGTWTFTTAAVAPNQSLVIDFVPGSSGAVNFISGNNVLIDGVYPYAVVKINGVEIPRSINGTPVFVISEYLNGTTLTGRITFPNVSLLPRSVLSAYTTSSTQLSATMEQVVLSAAYGLAQNTQIQVLERPTITLNTSVLSDLPGRQLRVAVETRDGLAIKLKTVRKYEVTPDLSGDDVLLIDIDDPTRFLKKPSGVRENNLWPTTTRVDHTGITDASYPRIPNSGYVHNTSVNFQAYNTRSLPDLYEPSSIVKPAAGHYVHIASSENTDWNVYRLRPVDSSVSYILENDNSGAVLMTDYSLFNYVDTNLIGVRDTHRYLDYHLALNNAQVSDTVVVWTNESIVQQKHADIINPKAPRMIEARIRSIGPDPNSVLEIVNMSPVGTRRYTNGAISASGFGNIATVTSVYIPEIRTGSVVMLEDADGSESTEQVTALTFVNGSYDSTLGTGLATATVANASSFVENTAVMLTRGVYGSSHNVSMAFATTNTARIFADANVIAQVAQSNVIQLYTPNSAAGTVTGVAMLNSGAGYTYGNANVSIVGDGTGATANIYVRNGIRRLVIDSAGSGYGANTTVTINGSNVSMANITPVIGGANNGIIGFNISDPGVGYELTANTRLSVTISGTGSNASVYAVVDSGITSLTVDSAGSGYTVARVVVTDSAGMGTGARYRATVSPGILDGVTLPVQTVNTTQNFFTIVDESITGARFVENLGQVEFSVPVVNTTFVVSAVDAGNSNVVLSSDTFVDANATANFMSIIGNVSLVSRQFVNYDGYYVVSNATPTSFNITRPSTVAGRVNVVLSDRTQVFTNGDHGMRPGEQVRIIANAYSGIYTIESAIETALTSSANSFVIRTPFRGGTSVTGAVVRRGMEIRTVGPHGILPSYAEQHRRVAVHFADPKEYNRVYYVDSVTPDSIRVFGEYPISSDTTHYYDFTSGVANLTTRSFALNSVGRDLPEALVWNRQNSSLVPRSQYSIVRTTAQVIGDGINALLGVTLGASGNVSGITVIEAGSGYSQDNTEIVVLGDGAGATAQVTIAQGSVVGITVLDGGSGYTPENTGVIITGPHRETATANVTISPSGILASNLSIVNPGSGYDPTPGATTVSILGANSIAAVGQVDVSNGSVSALTLGSGGYGYYAGNTTVSIIGANLSTATATVGVTANGSVQSVMIVNGGRGYSNATTTAYMSATTGNAASLSLTMQPDGMLGAITLINGGSGYFSGNTNVSITGGITAANVSANVHANGTITGFMIHDRGFGYTSGNISVVITGAGTNANATASLSTNTFYIANVTVIDGGDGYTSNSNVIVDTFATPYQLANLQANVDMSGSVTSITLGNVGSGYNPANVRAEINGAGTGATAFAFVDYERGAVRGVRLTNPGAGYSQNNVSAVITGTGTGAMANVVVLARGSISGVIITNPGSGYSATSAAVTVHGDGYDAQLDMVVQPDTGGVYSVDVLSGGAGYTSTRDVIVFGEEVLSDEYREFDVAREMLPVTGGTRLPVVTTIDHNRVRLNGSEFVLSSVNNEQAMVIGLNRDVSLRRTMMRDVSGPGFSLDFNILRDYDTEVSEQGLQVPLTAIDQYGPYVRDSQVLQELLGDGETVRGNMQIGSTAETVLSDSFNRGSLTSGPIYGLVYVDAGVGYGWNPLLRTYQPLSVPSADTTVVPDPRYTDGTGSSVTDQSRDVIIQKATKPTPAPRGHDSTAAILTIVPGTASSNPSNVSAQAHRWNTYDMQEIRAVGSDTYPRWRLRPNPDMVFEVYELVVNTNNDAMYLLVDRSYPSSDPHNFFGTVNAYNDFQQLPLVTHFYENGTVFDTAYTVPNTINLPPVEPGWYAGLQTIPEPMAIVGGNGTVPLENYLSMPVPHCIDSVIQGGFNTKILVDRPGMNSFLMWTPGLTPGSWTPDSRGPGELAGSGTTRVGWGYGSGYYFSGDGHDPSSDRDPATAHGPYPVVSAGAGWAQPQSRFLYSRDFGVSPEVRDTDNAEERIAQEHSDPNDTGLRPDEIFVACFWVEPHVYRNQLVGFDYSVQTSSGAPKPIHRDYNGTVTRVKYIRLSELPPDAVLQRPIPDTGWGGREWNNLVTDAVRVPSLGSDTTWQIFDGSASVIAGSSANALVSPGGVTTTTNSGITVPVPPRPPMHTVPVISTNDGPVLTGALFASLPSRGELFLQGDVEYTGRGRVNGFAQRPVAVDSVGGSVLKYDTLQQLDDRTSGDTPDTAVHDVHVFKINGKHPFTVYFNFEDSQQPLNTGAHGISILQSYDKSFATYNTLLDTQSTGEQIGINNGMQIQVYDARSRVPEVDAGLGLSTADLGATNIHGGETAVVRDTWVPRQAYNYAQKPVGVLGHGYVQKTVDASNGEYCAVVIHKSRLGSRYRAVVAYYGFEVREEIKPSITVCPDSDKPSRNYRNGARIMIMSYASDPLLWPKSTAGSNTEYPRLLEEYGYFGHGGIERPTASGNEYIDLVDNIYYPYHAPLPAERFSRDLGDAYNAYMTQPWEFWSTPVKLLSARKTSASLAGGLYPNLSGLGRVLRTDTSTTVDGLRLTSNQTMEFKGYYRAVVTGDYQFSITSTDASYVWISPTDDTSGQEYYTVDGYQRENGSKNYTWWNALLKNGGKHEPNTVTNSIRLEAGKYYFVRGIVGVAEQSAEKTGSLIAFRVLTPIASEFTPVEFSGRSCPGDDLGMDTPIFNPTPGQRSGLPTRRGIETTRVSPNYISNDLLGGGGGWQKFDNTRGKRSIWGTLATPSGAPVTDLNLLPSALRNQNQVTDQMSNRGLRDIGLGDRFVGGTVQRVSGGVLVPYAPTVDVTYNTKAAITLADAKNEPWYRQLPAASIKSLDTAVINSSPVSVTYVTDAGIELNNRADTVNAVVIPDIQGQAAQGVRVDRPLAATLDVDAHTALNQNTGITYNTKPEIELTPLRRNPETGEMEPAGPTAVAKLYRPTPTIKIDWRKVNTVGDQELIVNDQPIRFFEGQDGVESVIAQINASAKKTGVVAFTNSPDGIFVSVDDRPISIRNGCAGSRYKELADFYLMKGFTHDNTTNIDFVARLTPQNTSAVLQHGAASPGGFEVFYPERLEWPRAGIDIEPAPEDGPWPGGTGRVWEDPSDPNYRSYAAQFVTQQDSASGPSGNITASSAPGAATSTNGSGSNSTGSPENRSEIIIYKGLNFTGESMTLYNSIRNLDGPTTFNNRVRSVRCVRGTWSLWSTLNFQGTSITMSRGQEIADISGTFPYGNNGLTSLRLEALDDPDPGYDFNAELLKAMNAPRVNYVKTQSTGGRGYSKGDRLRLVGGTPATTPYDILRGIDILDPGQGYSSPQNLTVLIGGDGTTPGAGARAIVTSLDENGGIASMYVESSGITSQYDLNNPPRIRVFDSGDDIMYNGYSIVRRSQASAGSAPRVPAAPTNLVGYAGDTRVTLVWVAPAFNGGSPVTGYRYRQREVNGTWGSWTTTNSVYPGVTVEDLVNGTDYQFQVLAINAQGESPHSTVSEPVAPIETIGVPDAVENLLVYSPPSVASVASTAFVGWGTTSALTSSYTCSGHAVPSGFTQLLETNVRVAGNVVSVLATEYGEIFGDGANAVSWPGSTRSRWIRMEENSYISARFTIPNNYYASSFRISSGTSADTVPLAPVTMTISRCPGQLDPAVLDGDNLFVLRQRTGVFSEYPGSDAVIRLNALGINNDSQLLASQAQIKALPYWGGTEDLDLRCVMYSANTHSEVRAVITNDADTYSGSLCPLVRGETYYVNMMHWNLPGKLNETANIGSGACDITGNIDTCSWFVQVDNPGAAPSGWTPSYSNSSREPPAAIPGYTRLTTTNGLLNGSVVEINAARFSDIMRNAGEIGTLFPGDVASPRTVRIPANAYIAAQFTPSRARGNHRGEITIGDWASETVPVIPAMVTISDHPGDFRVSGSNAIPYAGCVIDPTFGSSIRWKVYASQADVPAPNSPDLVGVCPLVSDRTYYLNMIYADPENNFAPYDQSNATCATMIISTATDLPGTVHVSANAQGGAGVIVSDVPGIYCSSTRLANVSLTDPGYQELELTCSFVFAEGAQVALSAQGLTRSGSTYDSWTGGTVTTQTTTGGQTVATYSVGVGGGSTNAGRVTFR